MILLTLFGRCFDCDRTVYAWTIGVTLPAAFYDLLCALPEYLRTPLKPALDAIGRFLPLSSLGLGWVCPAVLGLCLGLLFHFLRRKKV